MDLLQINFFKPKISDFSNFTQNSKSLDQIFSFEKLHEYSYKNSYAQQAPHNKKYHSFCKDYLSSPY